MENIITGRQAYVHPILHTSDGPKPVNATATLTVDQIEAGVISSTSAAAVTMTTPTAGQIYADLDLAVGTYYDFVIDNSAGANTVTLALDGSIVALAVVTGGNTLTIASGKVGIFRLYFYSATAAFIARLA